MLTILAALVVTLALAGCGEDNVSTNESLPDRPKLTIPDQAIDSSAGRSKNKAGSTGSTTSSGDDTGGTPSGQSTGPSGSGDQTGGQGTTPAPGTGGGQQENTGGANAGVRFDQFCDENTGACGN